MTNRELEFLYERYHRYLLTVIRNSLYDDCSVEDAFDCLGDVFEIALQKKEDRKFNKDPVGWLVKTSRYVAANFNRRHLTRMRHHFSCFDPFSLPLSSSHTLLEDLSYKMAVENGIWEQILDSLSGKDRELFLLRYVRNLSLDEIARKLQINKTAVKVRLHRIKIHVKLFIQRFVGT